MNYDKFLHQHVESVEFSLDLGESARLKISSDVVTSSRESGYFGGESVI